MHLASHTNLPVLVGAAGALLSNAAAWVTDLNAGAVVTTMTVLGGGGVSLYVYARGQLAKAEIALRRDRANADLELAAQRARAERELRAEQEQADRDSLLAKVDGLRRSVEEGNRRVEDANKKLHDQAGAMNVLSLRHAEEMGRQHDQLALALQQARELAAELHEVRGDNRALRAEVVRGQQQNAHGQDRIMAKVETVEHKVEDLKRGPAPPDAPA